MRRRRSSSSPRRTRSTEIFPIGCRSSSKSCRFEIDPDHPYATGIREDMSIDQSMHSVFGASKVAADVLVQEYGRYFGMRTACFRGGCLTGPESRGHTTSWIPLVPDEVCDDRDALHGVWLPRESRSGTISTAPT